MTNDQERQNVSSQEQADSADSANVQGCLAGIDCTRCPISHGSGKSSICH